MPQAMILVGIAVLAYGMHIGEGGIYFIVFIPVIYGTGPLPVIGGLLIMFGFFLFMTQRFTAISKVQPLASTPAPGGENDSAPDVKRKLGGMVLIGPIPIIFGSDARITLMVSIIGLVILLLAFLFLF